MIYGVVVFGVLVAVGGGVFGVLALQEAFRLFCAADRHEGGAWCRLAFCERALGLRDSELARLRRMLAVRNGIILSMREKLKRKPHTVINVVCAKSAKRVLRVPAASRN